jgi:predicted enzyme related to lactoylglutathione lyase
LIARLEKKGVKLLGELVHGPNCRMITCQDSEGNSLILHQMNPKA